MPDVGQPYCPGYAHLVSHEAILAPEKLVALVERFSHAHLVSHGAILSR